MSCSSQKHKYSSDETRKLPDLHALAGTSIVSSWVHAAALHSNRSYCTYASAAAAAPDADLACEPVVRHVLQDNSTFLYLPWWADEQTLAQGVGLLLDSPGMTALSMAGKTPAAGRNFVTAADDHTLVPLLTSTAGVSTAVPFLIYLAANVSLGANLVAGIPVNRPLYFVGKTTEVTSIDFGMEVNQLVMLGTWSSAIFNWVSLENLAPGDRRSLQYAGTYDVLMGYHVWALLYQR